LSRRLFVPALVVLLIAGIAPLVVMGLRLVGEPSAFSTLAEEGTLSLLQRTIYLGLGAAGIALLLGVPFGWLTARTNVPGAGMLRGLGLLPFLMPPLFLGMTWVVLINEWILDHEWLTIVQGAPLTIALMGLSSFPLVALFTARAAESIDASQEEAALLAGGKRAVLAMELPLLLPSIAVGACFAFVFAIHDFALPDYVSSKGPKFNVYADQVFASWVIDENAARAVASSIPLVILTLLALIPALLLRRRGARRTLGSNFRAPDRLHLGRARWAGLGFCLFAITMGAGIPIARLLWEAGGGQTAWSLERFRAAFALALKAARGDLINSVMYAVAAATITVPVALILGHRIARARRGWFWLILVVVPISVPAILYGIGTITLWNHSGVVVFNGKDWLTAFYASGGMVVLMLLGRYLAFPTLVCEGAISTIDPKLEESAQVAGAGPATRLGRIIAPAMRPSLIGSWVLMFVLTMRELDAAVLVPAANHTIMYRVFNAAHFGRADFVAALALISLFVVILPGLLWSLFVGRKLEVLP
jgi:iron(III) transport system permease protein